MNAENNVWPRLAMDEQTVQAQAERTREKAYITAMADSSQWRADRNQGLRSFLKGLMPKPLLLKRFMAERARIERARQVKHALATLDRYLVLNAELAPDEVSEEVVVVSLRRPFENVPRRAVLDVQRLLDQAA